MAGAAHVDAVMLRVRRFPRGLWHTVNPGDSGTAETRIPARVVAAAGLPMFIITRVSVSGTASRSSSRSS